jgi:hypothetical protein
LFSDVPGPSDLSLSCLFESSVPSVPAAVVPRVPASSYSAPVPSSPPVSPLPPRPVETARQPAAPPLSATFETETGLSRLTVCRGSVQQVAAADLAQRLAARHPLQLIVDFNRIKRELPAEIQTPDYLLDWFEAPSIPLVSPLVLSPSEFPAWPEIVAQAWGQDALVCIYTDLPKPKLLEQLRASCKPKVPQNGTALGIWLPRVLVPLLTSSSADSASQLLGGIHAVLVEGTAAPDSWQYIGREQVVGDLESLGLLRNPEKART